MASVGLKSKIKKFLKSQGVNQVQLENGRYVRLANAKTIVLLNKAVELGF